MKCNADFGMQIAEFSRLILSLYFTRPLGPLNP